MECTVCNDKGMIGALSVIPGAQMLCPECKVEKPKQKGTPKTLEEAIERGRELGDIKASIEDFIRNKLCVVMMSDNITHESFTAQKIKTYLLGA